MLETRGQVGSMEIRYDRIDREMYGTRGIGPRKVRALPSFWASLDAWAAHLAEVCPAGVPEVLATGGFQVDKGNANNAHRRGIAFDLDGLFWEKDKIAPFVTLRGPDDVHRYLAIEAGLRQYFGVILGWWWNRAHKDHFHVSAKSFPGWGTPRRVDQKTLFVQLSLTHVLDRPVKIDGRWGPETRGAVEQILMEVGPGALDLGAAGAWESFCRAVELVGWGVVEAGG
jgi:hypothetical protein